MKKKLIALLAGAMVLSTVLSGCGSKAVTNPASTAASTKPVKLQVWLGPQWKGVFSPKEANADYDSFFKYAAEKYKKTNPNVTVEVQVVPSEQRNERISAAAQTKTLPDVYFDGAFAMTEFVHKGLILPLDDTIDAAAKADIPKGIFETVQVKGKTYFYPFFQMPGTLVYNADMFKQAGLDKYIGGQYDIATWTPEEFKTILEALKAKVPDAAPMALFCKNNQGDTWNMAYLRMFGNKYFDANNKLTVNQADGVKALQYLIDLKNSGLTVNGPEALTSNDNNAMFQNKAVAVSFTNSVLFGNVKADMENGKTPKFDARLANIPGETQPTTFTYVTGPCVMNTGDSDRIAAAKAFVKFVCSDPELVVASKNGLPVRASVTPKVKDELKYLEGYEKNNKYMINFSNNVAGYTQLRNALFPELQAAFTGAKTPQQALDSYVKNGNKIIEDATKDSAVN
jgi:multiple sugar transport system substrate-binding protein